MNEHEFNKKVPRYLLAFKGCLYAKGRKIGTIKTYRENQIEEISTTPELDEKIAYMILPNK